VSGTRLISGTWLVTETRLLPEVLRYSGSTHCSCLAPSGESLKTTKNLGANLGHLGDYIKNLIPAFSGHPNGLSSRQKISEFYQGTKKEAILPCNALVQRSVLRIACHPSVTLVGCDHIGWKSWKLIARAITSPNPSLFVAQTPRGTWGSFRETRSGMGKNGVLQHRSGNLSKMRKDKENLLKRWRSFAYKSLAMLFRMVPFRAPCPLPLD